MPLTIIDFLALFPEFSNLTTVVLQNSLNSAFLETGAYQNLAAELQNYAMYLYAAHYLKLEQSSRDNGGIGQVKRYKTKHDELEFFMQESNDPYLLTLYGQRLRRLLDSQYIAFCYEPSIPDSHSSCCNLWGC